MADTKKCAKCGRELPLEAFSKHRHTKDGLQAWCRECQVQQVKAGRERRKAEAEATTIQDVKAPETGGKAALLAEFSDDQILAELKRRGFFCRDLYKYVKIDFENI